MSNFEDRVRTRLASLDAAMPPASPPPMKARKRTPRRTKLVLVLAAAAMLVVGTSLASGKTPPLSPEQQAANEVLEERVRDDLAVAFGDQCVNEQQARDLVSERLHALGLGDWQIRVAGFPFGVTEAPCVGTGASAETHEILLFPSMGGEVNTALEALKDELLAGCYTWDEATAMLRVALEDVGISNPQIIRGGLRGVPNDDSQTYLDKFDRGCVLSAGAQSGITGRYAFYLAGR